MDEKDDQMPCALLIDVGYAEYYGELLQALSPDIDVMATERPIDDDLEHRNSPYKAVVYVPTNDESEAEIAEALQRLRRQRPETKIVLFAEKGRRLQTKELADLAFDSLNLDTLQSAIKLACAL